MGKMLEEEHLGANGLDAKQDVLVSELEKPEGKRTFTGRIEEIVAHLSRVISEKRAGPKVRGSIERAMREMKAIADNLGKKNSKAKLIDNARKHFQGLLDKMDGKKKIDRKKESERESKGRKTETI